MVEQNRRRENRVQVAWKAKVGVKGKGVEPAVIGNISLSGVYFESRMELTEGNAVLLESVIEHDGNTHTFLMECEVMRQISTNRTEARGYGARITKLGKKNLSLLLPIIADLWVTQSGQQKG